MINTILWIVIVALYIWGSIGSFTAGYARGCYEMLVNMRALGQYIEGAYHDPKLQTLYDAYLKSISVDKMKPRYWNAIKESFKTLFGRQV